MQRVNLIQTYIVLNIVGHISGQATLRIPEPLEIKGLDDGSKSVISTKKWLISVNPESAFVVFVAAK